MNAIILAAGRGSRMNEMTADKPKCLIELMGKKLLSWQLNSLRQGGVENILVITGYLEHKIRGNFETIHNSQWDKSNMVKSLCSAFQWLEKSTCIVSYSDIVYHPNHVKKISKSQSDIAITYDTLWKDLWNKRFIDPLSDAETFIEKAGFLSEIGEKTTEISKIQGQYMGLMRFTPNGWQKISGVLANLNQDIIDQLDMTSLFKILLNQNMKIETIPVEGAWCEADSMNDIEIYESEIFKSNKSGHHWSHDWRD